MDDQRIRLIFETLGTDGIAALRTQLAQVHSEAPAVAAALNQVDAATATAEKDTYDLADAYDVLGDEQKSVFTSAVEVGTAQARLAAGTGQVSEGLEKSAKSSGQARAGLLDISRAVQDFTQGGIGGILNNLEGIGRAVPALLANPLAAIGSFPALLTLAGVGLFTFKDQIFEAFSSLSGAPRPFLTAVEELKARLKELQDKPHPLVIDVLQIEDAQRKLDTLKAALAEYDAQQKRQSSEEATSGKKVQELLTESGPGAAGVEDRVAGMLRDINLEEAKKDGGRIGAAVKKRAEAEEELALAAEGGYVAQDAQRRINESYQEEDAARKQIADAAKAEYGGVLLRAREGHGPDQEDAQRRLAELLGAAGMGELAGQIGQVSPAQVKLTSELSKQGAEGEVVALAELKREQANQKLNEELTKQGQANEALGVKQAQDEAKKDRDEAEKRDKERAQRADKLAGKDDKATAAQFDAAIKGSGIADEAGAMLAQIQAQGGVVDPRTGQLRRMDADQQGAYVRRRVEQYLHRPVGTDRFGRTQYANVGMGGEETGLTAQAIVDRGQREVTTRLSGMAGQQLNNTGKLLAVADSLHGDVVRLQAQMTQQAQGVDGLVKKTRMTKKSPLGR